jgi:hypothetical protein
VPLDLFRIAIDFQRAKHRLIGGHVRHIGVEKRAVPVEQDGADIKAGSIHGKEMVAERIVAGMPARLSAIAHGKDIVALEREVVEAGGVTSPARHFAFFAADDMCSGAHLHATVAVRTVDQGYFELYGRAGRDLSRRKEIDAARTDVSSHQGHGRRLRRGTYANQAKRQRKRSAGIAAAVVRHADAMSRYTRETPRPGLSARSCVSG